MSQIEVFCSKNGVRFQTLHSKPKKRYHYQASTITHIVGSLIVNWNKGWWRDLSVFCVLQLFGRKWSKMMKYRRKQFCNYYQNKNSICHICILKLNIAQIILRRECTTWCRIVKSKIYFVLCGAGAGLHVSGACALPRRARLREPALQPGRSARPPLTAHWPPTDTPLAAYHLPPNNPLSSITQRATTCLFLVMAIDILFIQLPHPTSHS